MLYYSSPFSLIFIPVFVGKKRNDKEPMICFTQKSREKNVRNNWSFFIASIKSTPWPPCLRDMGPFINKTNTTSYPNIGSLKYAIEEKWNKMSEEFILKACKSFRKSVNTINEKLMAILSIFTILCLSSYFVVYF